MVESNDKNNKIKVLIVDDDDFLLEMYSLKFRESGYTVDIAHNGEEAVEKAKTNPAIILMDIVMPKMDGFEALRIIKKENIAPGAKILMLTNLGQKEDLDKGIKLGANDYIVKAHFTPSEVVRRVEALLENKK